MHAPQHPLRSDAKNELCSAFPPSHVQGNLYAPATFSRSAPTPTCIIRSPSPLHCTHTHTHVSIYAYSRGRAGPGNPACKGCSREHHGYVEAMRVQSFAFGSPFPGARRNECFDNEPCIPVAMSCCLSETRAFPPLGGGSSLYHAHLERGSLPTPVVIVLPRSPFPIGRVFHVRTICEHRFALQAEQIPSAFCVIHCKGSGARLCLQFERQVKRLKFSF